MSIKNKKIKKVNLSPRIRPSLRDCRERKTKLKQTNGDVVIVFYDQEEGYGLVRFLVASCSKTDNKWVLGSGCSYHLCTNKHLFSTSQSYNKR